MGRRELFTEFRLGGPKGRGYWEDLGVGGMITGKMDPSIIILGSDMGNLIKRVLPT